MKKVIIAVFLLFLLLPGYSFAQENQEPFVQKEKVYKAKVVEILREGKENGNKFQLLKMELLNGPQRGTSIEIMHGGIFSLKDEDKVEKGDKAVVIQYTNRDNSVSYLISDKYRLDWLITIASFFFLLVIFFNRLKGVGSIAGLLISIFIIVYFIVPQILQGKDPLLISILGSSVILVFAIYLAHGFSKKTTVALLATISSFVLVGIISAVFVQISKLGGLGGEDAYVLQYGLEKQINFRGLFLGGILIGALGVLDDVTTSLSASVSEISQEMKSPTTGVLFKKAMKIGQEHISSLVNTLILAYAGASLPIFLFIVINPSNAPLWSILNSQVIAEEFIRGMAGSIGIILAVPITALFASVVFSKK